MAEKKTRYLTTSVEDKNNGQLGLIIKTTEPEIEQKHTGFIFIKEDKPVLAHLYWSNDFRYHEKSDDDGYAIYWIDITKIPASVLVLIINELIQIYQCSKENEGEVGIDIPFGIAPSPDGTIKEGKYMVPTGENTGGLTCATFVNCLFEQFDFPILKLDSWEVTAEDTEWQTEIVKTLKMAHPASEAFMKAQEKNIGKVVRIKPEQMVGACSIFDFRQVSYPEAVDAGNIINEELKTLNC